MSKGEHVNVCDSREELAGISAKSSAKRTRNQGCSLEADAAVKRVVSHAGGINAPAHEARCYS